MNQTEQIKIMLERGPVTAMKALREAGCLRLAARIHDLRAEGLPIVSRTKRLRNGKTVAEYALDA